MSPSTQCIGSVVPLTIFHLYAMKSSIYEIQRADPTRLEALLRISGKEVDNWTKTWTRPRAERKPSKLSFINIIIAIIITATMIINIISRHGIFQDST